MFIILLITLSAAFAEDYSVEKYCFSSSQRSSGVLKKIGPILLPTDSVTTDENCLVIKMQSHRRELIQRFVSSIEPEVKIQFSSDDIRREPCLLTLEKIKEKNQKLVQVNVGEIRSADASDSVSVEKETVHIQTLKNFEFSINQDQVKGSCRYINSNRYEISLEVIRKPKQIIPEELPPGSVVFINNSPQNERTMGLQTQIQLNRDQKIELGGIIKDLENKKGKVDLSPSANAHLNQESGSERVYLSLQ